MRIKKSLVIWNIVGTVLAFLMLVSSVLAWFQDMRNSDAPIFSGTFKNSLVVYFQSGEKQVAVTNYLEDGLLRLALHRENGVKPDNYFTNLRIRITYQGIVPAYLRVKVLEQWEQTDADGNISNVRMPFTNFKLNANLWIDNRKGNDMYFYYCDQSVLNADPYILVHENIQTIKTVDFISGIWSAIPEDGDNPTGDQLVGSITEQNKNVSWRIAIVADIVQSNRYKEVWNIPSMPIRA